MTPDKDDLTRAFPGIPAELVHKAAAAGKHGWPPNSPIEPANRWVAFTDEELLGLDACFDACFEHSTATLTAVRSIVFEVEAELERRK